MIHWLSDGRAGLSAFDDVQDRSSAAMARFPDPAAEEAVRDRLCSFPPFLRPAARSGDARPCLDLAVSPDDRQARPVDKALGRGQPPARRAGGLVIKRGTLVDATIIAELREAPFTRAAASIRATPRRVSRRKRDKTYFGYKAHLAVDEERPCAPGRDDPGQCTRQPSGRSPDPGRRTGLLRRQGL